MGRWTTWQARAAAGFHAAETERLIRLVNDLLVLTRADAGTLKLDTQPFDLASWRSRAASS